MLSDEKLALAYDSVRSADYCNDSEQHLAALRAVAEAAVLAEREGAVPVLYQYRFQGMYGDVWRVSPVEWNGLKPVETRALYTHPPQASATVPDVEAMAKAVIREIEADMLEGMEPSEYAGLEQRIARAMLAAAPSRPGDALAAHQVVVENVAAFNGDIPMPGYGEAQR